MVPPSNESPADSVRPAKPKRWRRWVYRLVLATVIPVAFFLALEGALRLVGYGHSTAFLVRTDDAYENNTRFGWRFFPRAISRETGAIHLPLEKAPGAYRIFVLGGSAAQGVPDAAYSFSRFLEVMLQERYPSVRFEVINAAMTAVNSHVMLEVARGCAVAEPDLFIIYMGNNEVVGPFGAGTGFMGYSPDLGAIRTSLWVKSTRVGQLVENTVRWIAGDDEPIRWQGMAMSAEQRVPLNDPRLAATQEHFRRNLHDICEAARGQGAKVILCTVPVNLRHCAPFASVHRADLGAADTAAFDGAYDRGVLAEQADDYAQAVAAYLAAAELDDTFADLHFRLGRCYIALDQPTEARRHFALAREHDALRFRADEGVNARIREAADQWAGQGISLVDTERVFVESVHSAAQSPGEELFHEHVHLNAQGSYLFAEAAFDEMVRQLPPDVQAQGSPEAPVASFERCVERLALTDRDRARILEAIWRSIHAPPFTDQLGHAEMRQRLLTRRRALWRDAWPTSRVMAAYDAAVAAAPDDPSLRYNAAQVYLGENDLTTASTHLERMLSVAPNDPRAHWGLGFISLEQYRATQNHQDLTEAEQYFRRYLELLEHRFVAYQTVVQGYWSVGLLDRAEALCREGLTRRPKDTSLMNLLATTLLNAGRVGQAHQAAQQTLEIDDTYAVGWNTLGMIALTAGRPIEAVDALKKAIELDPNLAEAYSNLSIAQLRIGKPGEAITSLAKSVDLAPNDVESLTRYGQLLERHGQATEAIESYRQALLVRPSYAPAAAALVWLLATSDDDVIRDVAGAVDLGQRAAQLAPDQPDLLVSLAAACAADGQFDKAAATATQALSLAQDRQNTDLAHTIRQHLAHYQQGEPLP